MNNNGYHRASVTVLNWRKLPIHMKARYSHWIILSDASWSVNFKLTVTHRGGRRLSKTPSYPFEHRCDAEEAREWWTDNGCLAIIEEV